MAKPNDLTVVRPSWVPPRIEWWTGEDKARSKTIMIREGNIADLDFLARVWSAPRHLVYRWITQHNYSIYCAVRNRRTIVTAIVARHGPEETTVLRYFGSPGFHSQALLDQIIPLLRHEMPEWHVTWTVKERNRDAIEPILRGLGWKAVHSDDQTGSTQFVIPALIDRQLALGGAPGRKE